MSKPNKGGFWADIASDLGIDPDVVTANFEDVKKSIGQDVQEVA